MIEVQAHLCPSQKNFSPEKTVGENRTQPTVQATVRQKTVLANRLENRREETVQGTVGANRLASQPLGYRGGVYVKAKI